jgi:hypothetical protein
MGPSPVPDAGDLGLPAFDDLTELAGAGAEAVLDAARTSARTARVVSPE